MKNVLIVIHGQINILNRPPDHMCFYQLIFVVTSDATLIACGDRVKPFEC